MYTSYIGKKFLNLYRQKHELSDDFSARQFFDEVMFPLFFDSEDHLMHVHGSSFFQKVPDRFLVTGKTKQQFQLERLHRDIADGKISGSTYVGYAAGGMDATTSGQVTSLQMDISNDDMYASWIGQGMGIGVSGGLVMLLDEAEILWILYEGWAVYRKYLSQTPNLKDKQIETWNGHWLSHVTGKSYDPETPLFDFNITPEVVLGKLAISTIDWVKVVFALSKVFPNETITAYAYNLSQTNTTLGFVNIQLPDVSYLKELYRVLYAMGEGNNKDMVGLYSTFFTFKNACKLGVIGLTALEPDKLRQYMPVGTREYASGKDFKFGDESTVYQFQIFKTWIIAMLNNKKELNALAEQLAQALINFETEAATSEKARGKAVQGRLSDEVKASKTLREFIDNLTEIMVKHPSEASVFKDVKDAVIALPADLFPLFVTLVRFEYQFKKSTNA